MARSFNGVGDKITLGTGGGVGASGPWSCSAWVYPAGVQSGCIISKRSSFGVGSNQFDFSLTSVTTLRGVITRDAQWAVTTQFLTQSAWNHCGCACDSSGALFYINRSAATYDASQGGTNFSGNWQSGTLTNQNFWIGVTQAGSTTYFLGRLSDVAAWNVKLTASELIALGYGVKPYLIRPGSLVAYFPLDGIVSPEPNLAGVLPYTGTLTGTAYADGPPTALFTPRWPRNYDAAAVTTVPLSQTHFRFRTDTGAVDATPTWPANEDTNGYNPDTNKFRIRFKIEKVTTA